jgi:translocation and assembly module TamB
MYIDTLRVESVAATITAAGALGLSPGVSDSLQYRVVVDSLGGLRRYITKLTSAWAQPANAVIDSLAGTVELMGSARGSIGSVDLSGRVSGSNVFVRKEAGREITGTFSLANLREGPKGTVTLRFSALNIGGVDLDTLGAAIRFGDGRAGAFSLGALASNGVTLAATGDLTIAKPTTTVLVRELALVTDSSQWSLRSPANIQLQGRGVAIDSLILANRSGGRISLEGFVPDSGRGKVLFRADSIPLRDVGAIAQLRTTLSGWAHVTGQGAGTSTAPVMNVQATLRDVRYGGVKLERVNATAEYLNKRGQVAMDLTWDGRTALVARGSLPIELKYFGARLLEDSLRGSIRTDSGNFDIVEALIPGFRDAKGHLVANIDVSGTWKHPDFSGPLRIDNGEVSVDALGIRMKGVNVDVALFGHRDSLAVRRISGWSGTTPADSISLRGYVAYRDLHDPYVSMRLDARTFHALDKRALARLDVSTEPDGVRLRGRLRGATLTGGLVVDRGAIFLPDPQLARKQTVDFTSPFADSAVTAQEFLPDAPSEFIESLLLEDVRVTLGDDVWLRSREANIKLGGSLNVQRSKDPRPVSSLRVGRGAADDTVEYRLALAGTLRAERGTYNLALGLVQREFQVEDGTITFLGSSELAPELNISALHTVHTATQANRQQLRVRVRLTGPLRPTPIVTLESAENFALSQSDLVSYLIFGQPTFELSTKSENYVRIAAQTLFPTVQSFAASQLRNVIGAWADVVQLHPGSLDADRFSNGAEREALVDVLSTTRLGAEKQITQNLYMSLSTGLCQFAPTNQSAAADQRPDIWNTVSGKLEYRLSSDAAIKVGREPPASALNCGRSSTGRAFVDTPSQWGFSLFKSWRF